MHTFCRRINSACQACGQRSVPLNGLYCIAFHMSALAECLACMCATFNRSWEVSPVTPWGPGPILPAKKTVAKRPGSVMLSGVSVKYSTGLSQ